MTASTASNALQLLAFVNEAARDAVEEGARAMQLARIKIEVGTVAQATAFLKGNPSPEILLVEIGNTEEAPAQLDALADVVNPATKVIAAGHTDSIRFLRWLSDLGIDGYLLLPFTGAELQQAVAKGSIQQLQAKEQASGVSKQLVAVIGARGGVGTTLVAANLSAQFAKARSLPTALIDLDPYFGTAALSLDLEAGRGLRDAFEKPDRVDGMFLERVMIKPFSNLSVFGPEEPLMDPITIQPNAGESILAALREKYTMLIADVPRQMNPLTRHVLQAADHVVIVAEPQITSLRDALRIKDFIVDHLKKSVPLLVLNRVGLSKENELAPKEFAKHFGGEVAAKIPFLPEVLVATAQGELLDSEARMAPALAALQRVLDGITGESNDEEESPAPASKGSFLGRFVGKK